MRRLGRGVAIAALCCFCGLLSGCLHAPAKPPPGQELQLGGLKAEYRSYGRAVCDQDPKRLASELTAMNALLVKFVDATSAGAEGVWSEDQVSFLEAGSKALPPALDAYEPTATQAATCAGDAELGELGR